MPLEIETLVVDDEPPARHRLEALISDEPRLRLVQSASNGKSAVQAIRAKRPELVFLDVEMPDLDGVGVIEEVGRKNMPIVVFVTAYERYAVKAFDLLVADYLLKPVDDDRFRQAIDRVDDLIRWRHTDHARDNLIELLQPPAHESARAVGPGIKRGESRINALEVRKGESTIYVACTKIDYISAEGSYTRIHAAGSSHLLRKSLDLLEQQLDPGLFVRTHRSAIVNLRSVRSLGRTKGSYQGVKVQDGSVVPVSRSRASMLRARLEEWQGSQSDLQA